MRKTALVLVAVLVCSALSGCAELIQDLERSIGELDSSTPTDGLREALAVGTGRAVERRGRVGGYLGDRLVEIVVPQKFESAARALRMIGREDLVDEFKVGMNRAAEAAAPVARDVFVESIRRMTFDDARAILGGHETAATDFFRRTAGAELARRFTPIVEEKLLAVGATRNFDDLMQRIDALPLVDMPVFDLTSYVTDSALDGLFDTLAEEERKIRTDPLARTTDLLKRWFGNR
jgi:hypothetical protein